MLIDSVNDICFYSAFGNGDLFNSREIIRKTVEKYPNINFYYAHSKNPRMFIDIERLKFSNLRGFMRNDKDFFLGGAGDLYINTWIGRDGKYVLPGIGCTLESYIQMFNEIFSKVGMFTLDEHILYYLPKIEYRRFYIDNINKFLEEYFLQEKILSSNGDVHSDQAVTVDFTLIIETIAERYQHRLFITTERINTGLKNIFYTGDIIKAPDNFDLNEISFLSIACSTIIGRSSGPYVFTQTFSNYMNPKKKFLSFTKHENSSDLVKTEEVVRRKFWSNITSYDGILNKIEEILNA